MSPLSILPGRMRFESPLLLQQEELCRRVERKVAAIAGVLDVSINYRTGRVLIKFDESVLTHGSLRDRFESILLAPEEVRSGKGEPSGSLSEARKRAIKAKESVSSHFSAQVLLDLAAHLFLPKPLDLLLPVTVSIFKR